MDIRISGHQVETGAALQDHAREKLEAGIGKYAPRAIDAHATFRRAPGGAFGCDVVAHVAPGTVVRGSGEAHDAHQAIDQAAAKVEKQLRRYKRRLTDHHAAGQHARQDEQAAYTIFSGANEQEEDDAPDAPPIVAETSASIPDCSVADAVMMLDLRDTSALFFKNAKSGRHNMVYRREDGTIGWVEPRG